MTDRLQLSVVLNQSAQVRADLERAVEFAAAGVDVIGVPEAYGVDSVSQLGYLAARAPGVALIAQILSIYSRTPTLLAMTAAGLDAVSGGRFALGLGASGSQVVEGWHGVAFDAPLARTREVIEICRAVWRRERLEHHGQHYAIPLAAAGAESSARPLKLITHLERAQIPIHLAALGERNVELAAELADGWIPFVYVPEWADRVWGAALARGLARRDPALGRLQISAGGPFAITAEPGPLRELGRDRLALYVGGMGSTRANFYNAVVRRYGFDSAAAVIQERYLAGDRPAARAAVPAELLEGTSLIGPRSYLRDRLQAYLAAGVTVLQVDPIGPDPVSDLRQLRELVEEL